MRGIRLGGASAERAVKGRRERRGRATLTRMDTQDAPIQDGSNDASVEDKLAGLAEQLRSDAQGGNAEGLRSMTRQRLEESHLPTDDATVDAVVEAATRPPT